MGQRARILTVAAVISVLMLSASSPALSVQAQRGDNRTVWDGVYTAAQAARGRAHYETNCQPCHGSDLSGSNARPLVGESFMRNWRGIKLDSLLERARSMPPGAESSLGDDTYLDIITYVLESNQFPAGTQELKTEALRAIVIQGKDGPQPVENFSLVRVVGCLRRGSDAPWVVTKAGEPARTRDPEPSKDGELKEAEAAPGGAQTFQLMFFYPSPDAQEGHKVEVKGFLIRGPKDRINVSTWQSLAPACEQAP